MVFLRFPSEKGLKYFNNDSNCMRSSFLRQNVKTFLGCSDFTLYYNGKLLEDSEIVPQDATVHVSFHLLGGKGGFGSMLRAIGAQIEKTTNREACRDLSGRRLRDINEEQRLKKWLSKESEREAEKVRKRKARIERLKSKPKHNFVDFEYEKEISELPERIDEALTAGLQKANKRQVVNTEACSSISSKKKKLWMNDDLSGSSSGDDSDSLEASSSSESSSKFSQEIESHGTDSSARSIDPSEPSCSKNYEHEILNQKDPDEDSKPIFETPLCDKDSGSAEKKNVELQDSSSDGPPQHSETIETSEQEVTTSGAQSANETKNQVSSPIDLLSFETASELEELGLDQLKFELTNRGMKCGGNISERAQRLWKIRGLQPHEYPSNLMAKKR